MQKSKFKIIFLCGMVAMLVFPLFLKAQSLREQLQQCPVIIENGKINYYMPQQNGAYFQLPPARKPQYVNIFTVPWVQPLARSVKDTQEEVLKSLQEFAKQSNTSIADKEIFLRKLAWCVMLQTSFAKQIDMQIVDYIKSMGTSNDVELRNKATLTGIMIEDYRNIGK